MGSVSVSVTHQTVWGDVQIVFGTITMSNSYATGGDTLSTGDFGLTELNHLFLSTRTGGYVLAWDKANGKVLAYYGDYDAAADGALVQVAATTDLSSVVADFVAVGKHG